MKEMKLSVFTGVYDLHEKQITCIKKLNKIRYILINNSYPKHIINAQNKLNAGLVYKAKKYSIYVTLSG